MNNHFRACLGDNYQHYEKLHKLLKKYARILLHISMIKLLHISQRLSFIDLTFKVHTPGVVQKVCGLTMKEQGYNYKSHWMPERTTSQIKNTVFIPLGYRLANPP